MPAKKIMKQNPTLSVNQLIMAELLKKMKVKAKPMKGGACCVDYIAKEKKKKLDPAQRKELIKMLNTFMRESKKNQVGGNIIQDLFTGKKAKKFWHGFKRGFTSVFKPGAQVLAPIATALGQPEIGIPLGIVANAM